MFLRLLAFFFLIVNAAALETKLTLSADAQSISIEWASSDISKGEHLLAVAIDSDISTGSAVVPFEKGFEGSTVFLPFRADRLYFAKVTGGGAIKAMRLWKQTMWSTHLDVKPEFEVEMAEGRARFSIRIAELRGATKLRLAVYAKNLRANDGWGVMHANADGSTIAGPGDRYVRSHHAVDLAPGRIEFVRTRLGPERVRIYQLLPRLFSNVNEMRKPNGTLAENGVGKFSQIDDAALASLREMGFTHVWLTGVLRQATSTDYSAIGLPADDPDLLKGLAGSPYAIKDYFDVCPDYADNPAERLAEFKALLARMHAHGLRAIIDFVPNHVARSYESKVMPELTFGAKDDRAKFFEPANNFFHLHGSPLQLPSWKDGVPVSPTCKVLGNCDGRFDGERDHARVTGNNVASAAPGLHDWYETVKLNYGYDFTSRAREYPHGEQREKPIPNTWTKMDRVLAHWQEVGVDGFRCDMAHMVPPEFWAWAIGRARTRKADVFFVGEAYDNDPMKVPGGDPLLAALNDHKGNVMVDLLSAGFDAVYDDPSYKKLKSLYDGSGWANDLESALGHDFIFQNSLRYAENHDEVRLAARGQWGGIGMNAGRAVSAILFGLSRGPVLLYSGQEVGEPAHGAEGFGGDDARTTIFDYWSMPELVKWVNAHRYDGGRLSPEQKALRAFYGRLLRIVGEPAFRDGEFFGLNSASIDNERFGRLPGETASGHWLHAFLRYDRATGQRFLLVTNLNRDTALRGVHLQLSSAAFDFLDFAADARGKLVERLSTEGALTLEISGAEGATIPEIPPLTPFYFELQLAPR